MNAAIVRELRELASLAGKNSHRRIAYAAAAQAIEALDYPIAEKLHLRPKIPRVGDKIWTLIDEFYNKGSIISVREQIAAAATARSAFTKISGVGEAKADEIISRGIRTIPELRAAVSHGEILLTASQRASLHWYEDLQLRIPRAEVEVIAQDCCEMLECDSQPIIVGSYRRGAADSGDVDMIILDDHIILNDRINRYDMTAITERGGIILSQGPSRITFLYRTWVYMRQVDILYVPPDELGAALLYFTGSWEFNESIRRLAKDRGLRLNQTGLYTVAPDGSLQRIASKTEEDIFAALGLAYMEPHERIG